MKPSTAINFNELFSAPDRASAIVGAAQVEEQLKRSIQSALRDDAKTFDSLLGITGPVGSFGSQIDLAFLIRVIDADTRSDLRQISKIRNEFAHNHGRVNFEMQHIKSRCANLSIINSRLITFEEEAKYFSREPQDVETMVSNYKFCVSDVSATLGDARSRYIVSVVVIGTLLQLGRAITFAKSAKPSIAK